MTPRFRSLLTALFAASLAPLILVDAASGQAAGAGLQMLQGLTPEQREAILRQLGGGGGEIPGGTQGTSTGRQEQADEELLNFTLRQQRDVLADAQKQRAELDRLSPFLQGEDWVVVTIDASPLPGAEASTSQQANALTSLANLLPGGVGSAGAAKSAASQVPLALGARPAAGAGSAAGTSSSVPAGGYNVSPDHSSVLPVQEMLAMIDLIRSKNP